MMQMIQMMTTTETTTNNQTFNILLLVAAGSSSRMGGGIKKEYLPMNSGTVLSNSAAVFLRTLKFNLVCVTYPFSDNPQTLAQNEEDCLDALTKDPFVQEKLNSDSQLILIAGGSSRQKSVFNALNAIKDFIPADSEKLVFIHDGARPFVTEKIVLDTYTAAIEYGASVPALEPVDTQKEIDSEGFITRHLNRPQLAAVQTPQVFDFDKILQAHIKADSSSKEFTDDTAIWDEFVTDSNHCKIVKGDSVNRKITYIQDIQETKPMIRTGLGNDKHLLIEGRKLIIGGVHIPFDKGEAGHSDGDALLHAITDALLGASGMGDIGSYFPSEDSKWKDSDSAFLLKTVWKDITAKGWKLENLDCVVQLQQPKFLPYRQQVINRIAEILNVATDQVFVKAKTAEKTGEIGEGKAIECWCTCLLSK